VCKCNLTPEEFETSFNYKSRAVIAVQRERSVRVCGSVLPKSDS